MPIFSGVAAFLRWRREEGFPIQKVCIDESGVDREFVLLELGDVEVKMTGWNYDSDGNVDVDVHMTDSNYLDSEDDDA
jgi:hypothetical protein